MDDPQGVSVTPTDLVGQLTKLSELHDAGHLTDEQFEAFKTTLME